ncbi:MAG: Fumarate reductase flavoprotein subunit precursor [Syntrophorhabdaceae bacterium PtaU1.Bin034]|nr:MAG: Fumarate reductase flavoprotein subunit precursor [Syntrophorhabdaceae bacterium PtaU1.Bin034]
MSAGLHLAHVATNKDIDCLTCHVWTPGKRFSLPGQKVSFGSPTKKELQEITGIFGSWKNSGYTDSLHGKANIICGGCHGKTIAKEGDTVENSRCLTCHGPTEQLAARSAPEDFPDRNPHKSHLGEIDCTVCHKGHSESKTYCFECHKLFKIKAIPGGGGK